MNPTLKRMVLCGTLAALFGCTPDGKVWEPPKRLWPKSFLGRDFWTIMWDGDYYADPHKDAKPPKSYNPELKAHPLFNDCGHFSSSGRTAPAGASNCVWRTIRENYTGPDARCDASWEAQRPFNDGKPYVIVLQNKRLDVRQLVGPAELDYADYAAFTNSMPNLVGFNMLSEWANDVKGIKGKADRLAPEDADKREAIRREWLDAEKTAGEAEYLKKYVDRRLALYYNDWSKCKPMSSCARYDHWEATWGCPVVEIETSASTGKSDMEYRWDYASAITRGAARQFGIQWSWYYALYCNGWTHDGQWKNDSHCSYSANGMAAEAKGEYWDGPQGGVSPSAMRRGMFFGYLTGANYCQFESRSALTKVDPETGKDVFAPMGANYAAFHAFVRSHTDRGCLYTPMALLAPTLEGMRSFGGNEKDSSFMIDAFLFTLYPGWKRGEGIRAGREGYLHASRFPTMCDYLVADSTQPVDKYLEALRCYPVAVLVGDHAESVDIAAPLKQYVSEGNTLVVNAIYLARAGFGADFTGVAWDGSAVTNAETYVFANLKLAGARTLDREADGRVLSTVWPYGRGKVVVTAPLRMTPKRAGTDNVNRMLAGTLKFPYVKRVFERVMAEHYPVKLLAGEVSWGLNRTPTGWWLWALNNRGVTKFVDTFEKVDLAATETVSFDVSKLKPKAVTELITGKSVTPRSDGTISFTIPAGDLAILELK